MTKNFFYLSLMMIFILSINTACGKNDKTLFDFSLNSIIDVKGRQGIATNGTYYAVSGSKELYLYSSKGELLKYNNSPFEKIPEQLNHLGDIDIYNGEIYAGVENFVNGKGENIQIAIYDLNTLEYKRSIPINSSSGQLEVCGIAIDEKRGLIWLADWVNGEYLYRYSLSLGDYLGRLRIKPVPSKIQGIMVHKDHIFLTSDDGNADFHKHDHIYSIKIPESEKVAETNLKFEKLLDDFKRAGEVEGLCLSPDGSIFSVLMNRGRIIDEGIPKGFYPGYNREIHEIYVYDVKTKRSD